MNLVEMLAKALITKETAQEVNNQLSVRGVPSENRVIILNPTELNKTLSGIIIPGSVDEGVPKKGVLVQIGPISEDNTPDKNNLLKIGNILTYGLYAGKELELLEPLDIKGLDSKNYELRILSVNEILYAENAIEL